MRQLSRERESRVVSRPRSPIYQRPLSRSQLRELAFLGWRYGGAIAQPLVEMQPMEFRVDAALGEQFTVSALLDDASGGSAPRAWRTSTM